MGPSWTPMTVLNGSQYGPDGRSCAVLPWTTLAGEDVSCTFLSTEVCFPRFFHLTRTLGAEGLAMLGCPQKTGAYGTAPSRDRLSGRRVRLEAARNKATSALAAFRA